MHVCMCVSVYVSVREWLQGVGWARKARPEPRQLRQELMGTQGREPLGPREEPGQVQLCPSPPVSSTISGETPATGTWGEGRRPVPQVTAVSHKTKAVKANVETLPRGEGKQGLRLG